MPSDVVNLAKALVTSGVSIPDPELRKVVSDLATSEDPKPDTDDKSEDKTEDNKSSASTKTAGKKDN